MGDSHVGKTEILLHYVEKELMELQPTTEAKQYEHESVFFGNNCILHIVDTPGNHDLQSSIFKKVFPIIDGFILVYDQENISSFNNLTKYYAELIKKYKKIKIGKVPNILLGISECFSTIY